MVRRWNSLCLDDPPRRLRSANGNGWRRSSIKHTKIKIDIIGRVLEADVRQKKFQIWINAKDKVTVRFTEEQESTVTTALKEHDSVRLRVAGLGKYNPDGSVDRITRVNNLTPEPEDEWRFDPTAPRIEDVIASHFEDVPDEEWDNLPSDLIDNLDHYLYGTEKR